MQEKRQNISVLKSRLLDYIDFKGIKRPEFCRNSKISESLLKGSGLESEIGGDKLVSILTFYSDINPNWLLTGKGKMLLSIDNNQNESEPMDCNNCPLRKDIERYQRDIDRYCKDIDRLTQKLESLSNQDQPERKRQSA